MARRRYVRQAASGSWEVLKQGDRRSAVLAPTKDKAVARAREILRREGGGEIRVVNDVGKVVDANTVARPSKAKRQP
jgi:hypothetical protein